MWLHENAIVMTGVDPSFTRSQIDKLGERLRAGGPLSDEDLDLLARFQASLTGDLHETSSQVELAFLAALPGRIYEPTVRYKQLRSTVAKLQRQSTRLTAIQDLVGFRVVVADIAEQEAVRSHLPSDDQWKIIDRRHAPMHGYRALHVLRKGERGTVEVQMRTILQHRWADLSEAIDRISPGAKYGEGAPALRLTLKGFSDIIAILETAEQQVHPLDVPAELRHFREEFIKLLDTAILNLKEPLPP